jgi:Flp pilus assembly protein TadG
MNQQGHAGRPFGRRLGRKPRRRSRGQALVEFALVLPVFILLLAGMIDFGFAFYSYMTVINGARVGARAAIINPADTNGTIEAAVNAEAVALNPAPSTLITCTKAGVTEACTAATSGDTIAVKVSYTYNNIWPVPFAPQIPMSSTVTMRIE